MEPGQQQSHPFVHIMNPTNPESVYNCPSALIFRHPFIPMQKYTYLCLKCLKTTHGYCSCGGQLINLGDRKLAEWVSQVQCNRNAILQVFDRWKYQSDYIQERRFLVWINGFELQKSIRVFHPDRWDKIVKLRRGFNYPKPTSTPDGTTRHVIIEVTDRWLIEKSNRYQVELFNS